MKIQRRLVSWRDKLFNLLNLKLNKILYYPVINSEKDLSYYVNSIASSIPYRDGIEIKLMVESHLLNTNFNTLSIANFQGDFIKGRKLEHIKIIEYSFLEFIKSDLICVTHTRYLKELFLFLYKIQLIDSSNGSMFVPEFYKKINWRLNSRAKNKLNIYNSKIAFSNLLNQKSLSKNGIVIAGGPSLKRYNEVDFKKFDIVISVNDFVIGNLDFFEKSYLDVVCFSDSTLFFGASKFTKNFYIKLQEAFNIKPFYIIVDIQSYEIVLQNGDFSNYLIGIERKPLRSFQLISPDDLITSTNPSANILTSYAMIIGLSIVDQISLFGVDGLEENKEKIMNNKNQSSHRISAYENYNASLPGFYRTYESAVSNHNQYNRNLKKIIEFAEYHNKKVFTLFDSNYECLSQILIESNT